MDSTPLNAVPGVPALPAIPILVGTCFWIAGAARSGIAAALLLKKRGATVFVTDSNVVAEPSRKLLLEAGIAFEEGGHNVNAFIQNADFLVLSPAIPLNKGLALVALQNSIPILSEIEVASWFLNSIQTVVAITGTNGKSTVTHYLAQLFAHAGQKAVPCGNIGLPFSTAVCDSANFNVFSLELSSYQLESTFSLSPAATVLLNLQSDHLARYLTMEQYLRAKWRLALLTADSGICAIDFSLLTMALKLGLPLPRCQIVVLNQPWPQGSSQRQSVLNRVGKGAQKLPIATYGELSHLSAAQLLAMASFGYAWVETSPPGQNGTQGKSTFVFHCGSTHVEHTFVEPCLPGEHNLQNLAAASAVALFLGTSSSVVFAQWERATSSYVHLPHRLEFVGGQLVRVAATTSNAALKTISIVNDSKATNVESALVALRSFSGNVRLLLGGEPKGESFLPLFEFLRKSLVCIYPFGAAASLIQKEFNQSAFFQTHRNALAGNFKNLLEAADAALADSNNGDTLLLSPACASFDEFKNFEHRGDIFREWGLKAVHATAQPLQEK